MGHEISKKGIEVDRAKIEVFVKLPMPKCVKDIRSFLGHAGFYRRFIKYFSKIARPLTNLLVKDVSFTFDAECMNSWEKFNRELIYESAPDWSKSFEIMCDASDFAIYIFFFVFFFFFLVILVMLEPSPTLSHVLSLMYERNV